MKVEPDSRALAELRQWLTHRQDEWREVSCPGCAGNLFDQLAERDRFGLPRRLVSCRRCALVLANPQPTEELLGELFARWYRPLFLGTGEDDWEAEVARGKRTLSFLERQISLPAGARWHDFGCGFGGLLSVLLERGFVATGSELDPECLAIGQARGLPMSRTLDDQQQPFHVLSMLRVLHYLPDLESQLPRLLSRLAPNGLFYVELPGLRRWLRGPGCRADPSRLASPFHLWYFDLRQLSSFLARFELEMVVGTEEIRALFIRRPGAASTPRLPDGSSMRAFLDSTRRWRWWWWALSFLPRPRAKEQRGPRG